MASNIANAVRRGFRPFSCKAELDMSKPLPATRHARAYPVPCGGPHKPPTCSASMRSRNRAHIAPTPDWKSAIQQISSAIADNASCMSRVLKRNRIFPKKSKHAQSILMGASRTYPIRASPVGLKLLPTERFKAQARTPTLASAAVPQKVSRQNHNRTFTFINDCKFFRFYLNERIYSRRNIFIKKYLG
jgi:hypothetical protein